MVISVPYHLDERIDDFDPGVPVDQEISVELPPGGPWERMAALYEQVACAVAAQSTPPVMLSGDCTTSLGVLAGLQRAGRDVGIVWLDAHADFHTEATTTSGYLGGMPLALAVGVGTLTLPDAFGLRPVPQARAVLVDARDTDPGEHVLLERCSLRRTRLPDLDVADLPEGQLYLHVDVDVCDPAEIAARIAADRLVQLHPRPQPGPPTTVDDHDYAGAGAPRPTATRPRAGGWGQIKPSLDLQQLIAGGKWGQIKPSQWGQINLTRPLRQTSVNQMTL